ncbi:MAG TPA: hypothetical protein HA282_01670 [Nanoarchaeota archaeon]|nr:hypothetical protein [Nanoarchaeota archaeon]HIH50868.1 hypothetical protein [Nanoarchaeota archaeon]HIH65906.1 hypothetical protein [Nanoarchaeota archaeon]
MVQEIQEKQSLGNYLILEGRAHGSYEYPDTLIAKKRSMQSKKWQEAQDALKAEGKFMPTIRQYADFLNLLKSGNAYDGKGHAIAKSELDSILDEILELRNPYRAEHLDASFSKQGEQFYITYHKFNSAGSLEQVQEPLQECLMQDKTPGIDLEDWFKKANEQGLPSPKTKKGSLYYWCPREGRVAGFDAYSGRAILNCDRDPLASYSALGVREGISVAGGRGRDEMII